MSENRLKTVRAYDFQSDFSPPRPVAEAPAAPDADTITLKVSELAILLADARDGAARIVRDEALKAEGQRLSEISADLKSVMGDIVALAGYLETAALDEDARYSALQDVRRIARRLVDGQHDLFGAVPDTPTVN